MTEQHLDHDDLVALALQAVTTAERSRFAEHLVVCPACRGEYAAIQDDVEHALAAAPSIAPPAGFSGRVLAAMGIDDETATASGPRPAATAPATPTRATTAATWRMPLLAAAAALVVGLALGVGGTTAVLRGETPTVSPAPAYAGSAADLVTRTGVTVGTAGLTELAGQEYLVVSVAEAKPGMTYECIVVGTDGARRSAGTWTLDAEEPGGPASGTWVVPLPRGGVARVELVTPSGATWSTATF